MSGLVKSAVCALLVLVVTTASADGPTCQRYPDTPDPEKLQGLTTQVNAALAALYAEPKPAATDFLGQYRRLLLGTSLSCGLRAIAMGRMRVGRPNGNGETSVPHAPTTLGCGEDCIVMRASVYCGPGNGISTLAHEGSHLASAVTYGTEDCEIIKQNLQLALDHIDAIAAGMLTCYLLGLDKSYCQRRERQACRLVGPNGTYTRTFNHWLGRFTEKNCGSAEEAADYQFEWDASVGCLEAAKERWGCE